MKLPDIELVSAKVHASWMLGKLAKGVTSRLSESEEELMVPYEDLSEAAKDLDRDTVRTIYAAIDSIEAILELPTLPQTKTFIEDVKIATAYTNRIIVESDGYPMFMSLSQMQTLLVNAFIEGRTARREPPPQIDEEAETALRSYLWLSHGHQGVYGDDGEMQCGQCAPVWDYRRAPLADVIHQARKAREEVNIAALIAAQSALREPPEAGTYADKRGTYAEEQVCGKMVRSHS